MYMLAANKIASQVHKYGKIALNNKVNGNKEITLISTLLRLVY